MSHKTSPLSDVTDFLEFLIGLGQGSYLVNEEKVILISNGEVLRKIGPSKLPIILLHDDIKNKGDYQVLNPFIEGQSEAPAAGWLYRLLRISFCMRLVTVINIIVEEALKQKKLDKIAKKDREESSSHLPPKIINLVSMILDDVDEKMVEEVSILDDHLDTFMDIIYFPRTMLVKPAISIVTEGKGWKPAEAFRVKTIKAISALLLSMFQVKSHTDFQEKYTVKAKKDEPPKLSAQLNLYFQLYEVNAELFDQIDQYKGIFENVYKTAINLSVFYCHLDQLSHYFSKAKFLIHRNIIPEASVNTNQQLPAPSLNPVPQQQPAPNTFSQYPPNAGQQKVLPPAVRLDGTYVQNAGLPVVPNAGQMYYGPQLNQPVLTQNTLYPPQPQGYYQQQTPLVPSYNSGYNNYTTPMPVNQNQPYLQGYTAPPMYAAPVTLA